MNFEYLELSTLREKLDKREISSVELTKYFLERIKNIDPKLNSFITVCEEEALRAAKEADEYIATPGENPLLCGIPYAAKDLFCTKGIRTTAASKILNNYIPPYDATVIAKLREQKAVLLGKTNMDQFAHGSSGETSAYGATKNPWDLEHMPGGSSSGSAAAVAAGLIPWATATETGGSIRVPASFCGLSGWKPTYGRVSRYGVISMCSSTDSIGAVALTVKDLMLLANAMSGVDPKDSTTGDKIADFRFEIADLKGMRVGIPKEYFIDGMDDGVRQKVEDAIEELEKMGAEIRDVSLPNTKYAQMVYAIVCPAEISSNLARYDGIRFGHSTSEADNLHQVYEKSRAEGFGDEAKRRILTGTYVLSSGYYDAYYKRAQQVRGLIIQEFMEVFKTVDVLACPVSPTVAQKLGHAADDPLFGYITDQLNIPASLAGLPALSIPCGFAKPTTSNSPLHQGGGQGSNSPSKGGENEQVPPPNIRGCKGELPVGFQIIGPQWGEQKIFNVGASYQQATDWHRKFPRI